MKPPFKDLRPALKIKIKFLAGNLSLQRRKKGPAKKKKEKKRFGVKCKPPTVLKRNKNRVVLACLAR